MQRATCGSSFTAGATGCQLGLGKQGAKRIRGNTGIGEADRYEAVRLTIQGRACLADVLVPDDIPVLVGQIPLENLDLVMDLRGGQLVGNPAHGGVHMFEMYLRSQWNGS